jgi:hypothetical protein
MSNPTPGSDPNYPQGALDQSGSRAPQQGYDPAPPYSAAPAAYDQGHGDKQPGSVKAAAIIGIVWGVLGALAGILALVGASLADELDADVEVTGLDVVLGVVSLVVSIALLVGGIRVLKGKAPKLLLFAAVALIVLWVVGTIVNVAQDRDFSITSIVGPIIAALIVALLVQPASKRYFAARGHTA